ncbi:hypothetical protein [Candidatus Protochlamydia sp. R18]|uniref:hypothetical protein n=1 Tax=Candidatus Protochlamydia sp. R18 TaxID=1353977 RepID=UPI0005AAE4EB|nr:hypothetical protein [Candidatus Protochlamydia sp. R18]
MPSPLTSFENFSLTAQTTAYLYSLNQESYLKAFGAKLASPVAIISASAVDVIVHATGFASKLILGGLTLPWNFVVTPFSASLSTSRSSGLASSLIHLNRLVESIFTAAILPFIYLINAESAYQFVRSRLENLSEKQNSTLKNEITSLKNQISKQQQELNQKRVDLEAARRDLGSLTPNLNALQKDIRSLEEKKSQDEQALQQANQALQNLQREKASREAQAGDLELEKTTLLSKIAGIEASLKKALEQVEQERKDNASKENTIVDLQGQLTELKKQLSTLNRNHLKNEDKQSLQQANQALQNLQREKASREAQAEDLELEKTTLLSKIAEIEASLKKALEQVEQERKDNASKENTIVDLQGQLTELNKQLSNLNRNHQEHLDQEKEDLKNQLETLKRQLNEERQATLWANNKIIEAEKKIEEEKNRLTKFSADTLEILKGKRLVNQNLIESKKELEQQIQSIKTELAAAEEQKQVLSLQVESSKMDANQLQEKINSLENEKQELLNRIKVLEETIAKEGESKNALEQIESVVSNMETVAEISILNVLARSATFESSAQNDRAFTVSTLENGELSNDNENRANLLEQIRGCYKKLKSTSTTVDRVKSGNFELRPKHKSSLDKYMGPALHELIVEIEGLIEALEWGKFGPVKKNSMMRSMIEETPDVENEIEPFKNYLEFYLKKLKEKYRENSKGKADGRRSIEEHLARVREIDLAQAEERIEKLRKDLIKQISFKISDQETTKIDLFFDKLSPLTLISIQREFVEGNKEFSKSQYQTWGGPFKDFEEFKASYRDFVKLLDEMSLIKNEYDKGLFKKLSYIVKFISEITSRGKKPFKEFELS